MARYRYVRRYDRASSVFCVKLGVLKGRFIKKMTLPHVIILILLSLCYYLPCHLAVLAGTVANVIWLCEE